MVETKSHGEKSKQLIFSPYRAVGFVSNNIPLDLIAKGTDHFVVTSVGKSYHLYNIVSCFLSVHSQLATTLDRGSIAMGVSDSGLMITGLDLYGKRLLL